MESEKKYKIEETVIIALSEILFRFVAIIQETHDDWRQESKSSENIYIFKNNNSIIGKDNAFTVYLR